MPEKKTMTFEYVPVSLIYENMFKNGDKKVQLRIGRWSVNGIISAPFLEKREFYLDKEDGKTWKQGKAKGFNQVDIQIIINKKDFILEKLSSEIGVTRENKVESAPF